MKERAIHLAHRLVDDNVQKSKPICQSEEGAKDLVEDFADE